MISHSDRKMYSGLIDEAIQQGAKQKVACTLAGISYRTYQRWNQKKEIAKDQRMFNTTPVHNKLSEAIRQEIIDIINKPEYSSLTPHQIVPT